VRVERLLCTRGQGRDRAQQKGPARTGHQVAPEAGADEATGCARPRTASGTRRTLRPRAC
jgi:hypothetical protein